MKMSRKFNANEDLILILKWASPILAIIVAVIATWIAVFYASQPLLELHGFRQTHTAITSYWMIQDGWRLAYETPVAGYPWSIPMEFPIYQTIVALIAWLGNFQLDSTGRLISFCFLLACAWPAFMIVRRLNLPTQVAWVFCALLWSSPIYLFWGRTFMIETAALFFTVAAIPYAIDLCSPSPSWRSVFLFMLFATLGMLQKVTTTAPLLIVVAFIILATHLRSSGLRIPPWRQIVYVILALSVPIIITMLWTNYADALKMQNQLGAELTSKNLLGWNFGTIEERFNINILKTIFWDRMLVENAAGVFGIAIILGALFWGESRVRPILLSSIILFMLPILLFTHLHWIHTYYQASAAFFLIGALAVATVFLLPEGIGRYIVVPIITIIFVASNYYFFLAGYANYLKMRLDPSQTTILKVGELIRQNTPEDSGIVVFGLDWSSEIAYYAQRKSFTVPGWSNKYETVWKEPTSFLGGKELGAIVFCTYYDKPTFRDIVERPDIKRQPRLINVAPCYIWFPSTESNILPSSSFPIISLRIVDKRPTKS